MDLLLPSHPAFKAGFEAYLNKISDTLNPYPQGTVHYRLWLRGFLHAMQTEKVKNHE